MTYFVQVNSFNKSWLPGVILQIGEWVILEGGGITEKVELEPSVCITGGHYQIKWWWDGGVQNMTLKCIIRKNKIITHVDL